MTTINAEVDTGTILNIEITSGASGSQAFTDLTDSPSDYTGHGGETVVVNVGETGLEFSAAGAGDMITATYDAAGVSEQLVGLTATQTMTNKTLTSPVLNTGVSGTAILDQDDMAADSNTQLATQQSIKAYVDNNIPTGALASLDAVDTDQITDDAVTYAKMQNVSATDRLLGRDTAGAGVVEEIAPAAVRTMLNVEDGAEANNISDVNATDLTDGGDSTLHYHATDRSRANHTGTQTASTISDFDTEVSNNTSVSDNTTHRTSNGTDHSYIDQDVTTTGTPTFGSVTTPAIETAADVTITLSDNAGSSKLYIKDSDDVTIFSIDSDGTVGHFGYSNHEAAINMFSNREIAFYNDAYATVAHINFDDTNLIYDSTSGGSDVEHHFTGKIVTSTDVTIGGDVSANGAQLTKVYYVVGFDDNCDYVCDGTADDVQLNAAINAAHAAGGGTVHLKEGTYEITAYLDFANNDNIVFEGEGWGTILRPENGHNNHVIYSDTTENLVWRDFMIDGNGANQTTGWGIWCNSGTNNRAINLYIKDIFAGAIAWGTGSTRCDAYGCYGDTAHHSSTVDMFVIYSATYSSFTKCWATGCTNILDNCFGIYNPSGSEDDCRGSCIDSCVGVDSTGNGVNVEWARDVRVINCHMQDMTGTGIVVNQTTTNNVTISGNVCYSNGDKGISINAGWGITVSNNVSKDNTNYGIYVEVDDADDNGGCSVNNNVVTGNGGIAINVNSANDVIVNGNTVVDNGTEHGIQINGSDRFTVIGNNIFSTGGTEQGRAISINASDDGAIVGNTAKNNDMGIYLYDCEKITITGNSCYDNTTYGIRLNTGTKCTIHANVLQDNGTDFRESDNTNDVSGNIVSQRDSSIFRKIQYAQAGEALSAGDVVYLSSDGKWYQTDADAESTADTKLMMCTESLSSDAYGHFIVEGRYTTTGLTTGNNYYVSTTAGGYTSTAPSGSGDIVRIVGTAEGTTRFYFQPDRTYIEV